MQTAYNSHKHWIIAHKISAHNSLTWQFERQTSHQRIAESLRPEGERMEALVAQLGARFARPVDRHLDRFADGGHLHGNR